MLENEENERGGRWADTGLCEMKYEETRLRDGECNDFSFEALWMNVTEDLKDLELGKLEKIRAKNRFSFFHRSINVKKSRTLQSGNASTDLNSREMWESFSKSKTFRKLIV